MRLILSWEVDECKPLGIGAPPGAPKTGDRMYTQTVSPATAGRCRLTPG